MNIGLINSYSGITKGNGALQASKINGEKAKFSELLETLSSSQVAEQGRLNGDFKTGFTGTYTVESDTHSLARGAAANQANDHVKAKSIDKTSKLYEKSMELESYFVKQMLSEMRKTVNKSALGGNDFAGKMYEDMLFDEYATSMTKNAGFGLADQIYLSLAQ